MIDVSDLMCDPDFAANYKVHRSWGQWQDGRFTITKKEMLDFYGPVQSAEPEELEQFPEGDRQKVIMKFFCSPPNTLYITEEESEIEENETITSDVVEFEGFLYKIIKISPWRRYGFIRAFGCKIGSANKNG